MGMSPPLITTKRSEWVFYMPYMVSASISDLPSSTFTPIRSRGVLRTVGLDPVLYHEALVLPLFIFVGHCGRQRTSCNGGVSFQNTRGWVSSLPGTVNVLLNFVVECLLEIGQHSEEAEADEHSAYRRIFRLRAVHLMAFFILVYVGYVFRQSSPSHLEGDSSRVEVTIGGWIVTYIIQVRGGGPSSGYISSGFFGGLTFGRVALLWVNKKVVGFHF